MNGSRQALVLVVGKGKKSDKDITAKTKREGNKINGFNGFMKVWRKNEVTQRREAKLKEIRVFLETLKLPEELTKKTKQLFLLSQKVTY